MRVDIFAVAACVSLVFLSFASEHTDTTQPASVAWAARLRGAAMASSGHAQGSVQPAGVAVRTSLRRLPASRTASAYSFGPSSNPVHNLPQIHLLHRRRRQRRPHPPLPEHHGAAPGCRGARSRPACPRWPSSAHASQRPPSPGRSGVEQLRVPPAHAVIS
jgi:hypothetical protein